MFYFIKTWLSLFGSQVFESVVQDLYLNKYTTTTTRIGCNNIISAANKTELASQEIGITKMASVFTTINRGNTTTTVDTMAIGDNDVVSTASDIEFVFLEIRIVKIEDNSIAARTSSGADITEITKENNDLILVTDKFNSIAITDKNDPLLVTDKNIWSAGTNFFGGIQHSKRYFGG